MASILPKSVVKVLPMPRYLIGRSESHFSHLLLRQEKMNRYSISTTIIRYGTLKVHKRLAQHGKQTFHSENRPCSAYPGIPLGASEQEMESTMNIDTTIRTISLIVAPVVMVSSCALFLNGLLQRYHAISSTMRMMHRERLDL